MKVLTNIFLDVWKSFSALNVYTLVSRIGKCLQVIQKLVKYFSVLNLYTLVCGRGLLLQVMQKPLYFLLPRR